MAPFDYAVASGFDAFEWFPDKKTSGAGWDEQDLDVSRRAGIRALAGPGKLRLSVHARWGISPLAADGERRLREEIAFAEDLGAAVLVVHYSGEEGVAAYARAILPALEFAAGRGIEVAIENTVEAGPAEFNELFAQLRGHRRLDSPRVGMCLDLGHANLCGATRNNYLGFMDKLSAQVPIIHVHWHENWGDADTHLTLFTGPSAGDGAGVRGVVRRLKQRGFTGSIILEQWPEPPALLGQARRTLLAMWLEA